ncbi:MAG: glycosyltransferase [Peptostreptococcaceae bacterium]|nr:glycosyltransferase [Peptostreptococcaceae bacterium]
MIQAKEYLSDYKIYRSPDLTGSPKISVLMPTYCRGDNGLLQRAIRSVLAQSFRDFELIIIDDGSTDLTRRVVEKEMAEDPRIVYIRNEKNSGLPSIKVMQGFYESRGEYIAYQFDDDRWYPHALQVLYEGIREEPRDTFVYGACRYVKTLDKSEFVLGAEDLDPDYLLYVNTISNNAVLHHREIFDLFGAYDPSLLLRRVTDWDMWKRWIYSGARAKRVDSVVSLVEEQRVGSLNQTVKNEITLYKMMESLDLKSRNERLRPENFPQAPIDDLSFIESPSLRLQLYYEKIHPFFIARAGRDEKMSALIDCSPVRPLLMIALPWLGRREYPFPQMGTDQDRKFSSFYMTTEQLTLDPDSFIYPDAVLTETLEELPEGVFHLMSGLPLIVAPLSRMTADIVYREMKKAIVRGEIRSLHILRKGEDSPEDSERRAALQPELEGMDIFELRLEDIRPDNAVIDAHRFKEEMRDYLSVNQVEAIFDTTGSDFLQPLWSALQIPAVSEEEKRAFERAGEKEAPLITALFHRIRCLQAKKALKVPQRYPAEFRTIETPCADLPREKEKKEETKEKTKKKEEKRWEQEKNLRTQHADRAFPLCPAECTEGLMQQLMEKNLRIEELQNEIRILRNERLRSRGYLTAEVGGAQAGCSAPDVRDLCIELDSYLTDPKILLLHHLTGENRRQTRRFRQKIAFFPCAEELERQGYYLTKTPSLTKERVWFYTCLLETNRIDRLTLCLSNHNPLTEEIVLRLQIMDSRRTLLRQINLRGRELPTDGPLQIDLDSLILPEDKKLLFLFTGEELAAHCGIRLYEWRKRSAAGRTIDAFPLMKVEENS